MHFQKVWCGSGVLGFVGEGYWWSRFSGLKIDDARITFVTKTITIESNPGNVVLNDDFQPERWLPETLRINFFNKTVWNRFGLANPGLDTVLATGKLQSLPQPFFISVGSTSGNRKDRLNDFCRCKDRLSEEHFNTQFGIQINFSCPNLATGDDIALEEKISIIAIFAELNVPITIKLSPETDEQEFVALDKVAALDGFVFSNTKKTKRGGLSGLPLKANNIETIKRLRANGVKKHINAGGGILSVQDAEDYLAAGADSVFLWSITFLRPWRVQKILSKLG